MAYQTPPNTDRSPGTDSRNAGPLGSGSHIVQPGECFLSLAYRRGFFWETLWNLPGNSDLRSAREDPGQILVGDQVVIPDRRLKEVPAATDARHTFRKRGLPVKLRLVVEYEDDPVANADYVLVMGGSIRQGTTDDHGLIEASIPPDASDGTLEINGLRFDLRLGALDPSSEDLGVQLRLANLGFYQGDLDGIIGPQTSDAIARFQARTGLQETGELDEATLDKLNERHDETHEKLAPVSGPDEPSPWNGAQDE